MNQGSTDTNSQLKAGYKQTEVGIIPEDSNVTSINQISEPVRGGSPRPAGSPKYFNGSFIPWLTVAALTNIPQSQIYVTETVSCLTEAGSLFSRTLSKGTLIIANSGATLGIAKILGIRCCANDGIAILSNISKTVIPIYLTHYINSKTVYLRDVVATGNGQPNLNTDLIGNLKFPLPPTTREQEAIASTLSDIDATIESLDRLLTKKRQIKQGAMQELLRSKDGWIERRLGDISHIQTGSRNNQDKVEDGEYPLFVRSATVERINTYSYECEAILIPGEGGIGSIFHYANGRFDAHQRVYVIRDFSEKISGKYVYLYMSRNFGFHAMQNSVKATVDSLRLPTFQNFQIFVPSTLEEQNEIANILSDMDAEIESISAKLTKTRQLKQGMMHELLTGRIRLV